MMMMTMLHCSKSLTFVQKFNFVQFRNSLIFWTFLNSNYPVKSVPKIQILGQKLRFETVW